MSHRSRFYVTQKSRKSQKDYIYVPIDFMSHRSRFYVTQKPRKTQKDIFMSRLILCHTETTEITERYMSHRNHGSHRKIYFCEILKPVVSYAKRIFRDFRDFCVT